MKKFINLKDKWLRFGCFLSGYNYEILNECSEISKREVKKVTAALTIILTIWMLIGYVFTFKYLGGNKISSVLGSIFLGFLIIQIERQIILTNSIHKAAVLFRFLLGVVIATIGATVIDQYVFSNDIKEITTDLNRLELNKKNSNNEELYQINIQSIDKRIDELQKSIELNNLRKQQIPQTIFLGGGDILRDSTGKIIKQSFGQMGPNPELTSIENSNNEIRNLISKANNEKIEAGKNLQISRDLTLKELNKEEAGFLKELNALIGYLLNFNPYPTALIFYLLWFLFFLLIELLILMLKVFSEKENNDYENMILKHSSIRNKTLENL